MRSSDQLRLRILATDSAVDPPPPAPQVKRSFPFLLMFGILGVVTGLVVLAMTIRWYDSLVFSVADKPVSLARGHIGTGDFTIHLKGTYGINFYTDTSYSYGCPEYLTLKTHWAVMQDGQVIAHRERGEYYWESPDAPIEGGSLGSFEAEPGTYSLDVEQLVDGRCLDVRKPRLRVSLSGSERQPYDEQNASLQLFSLLSVGTGLSLLFAYGFSRTRQRSQLLPLSPCLQQQRPTWGITGLRHHQPARLHRSAMNPLTNSPTIALVCSLTWFTWLMPTWIVYACGHRASQGLSVSLGHKGIREAAAPSGLTAPLVQIDANRRVFLNYKLTTWEELPASLDFALYGVPVRVVYFEGDKEIPFMDAARAIDIIQGLGAKAILLTPDS